MCATIIDLPVVGCHCCFLWVSEKER